MKIFTGGPVACLSRVPVLAGKANTGSDPRDPHGGSRVDSCRLWHTGAHSQTHQVPKEKGGKGGPRIPKPGKGFSSHAGLEMTVQGIRALPRAARTDLRKVSSHECRGFS